jgi:hypothetical protein
MVADVADVTVVMLKCSRGQGGLVPRRGYCRGACPKCLGRG